MALTAPRYLVLEESVNANELGPKIQTFIPFDTSPFQISIEPLFSITNCSFLNSVRLGPQKKVVLKLIT